MRLVSGYTLCPTQYLRNWFVVPRPCWSDMRPMVVVRGQTGELRHRTSAFVREWYNRIRPARKRLLHRLGPYDHRVPCWIYLRGDSDAILSNDAADAVLKRVDEADGGFITITEMPLAHDDEPRTGYVRASEIAPVLHMHPRRYEAELNDPLTGTRATRPSQLSVFGA